MSKFLHVITHFAPDFQYGGVVESGHKLYANLTLMGDFSISTVSRNPGKVLASISGKGRCYRSRFFHRFGFSFGLLTGLWRDVKEVDVVYSNGIVTFPNTLAQFYSVLQGKPFALATHGLTAWSYSYKRIRKAIYFNLITFPLMRRAAFIRVTSQGEKSFLEARGFENVVMIQNGISLAEFQSLPARGSDRFSFLFLGRMGAEKGIVPLLAAYAKFRERFPGVAGALKLIGPDLQGYLAGLDVDLSARDVEYSPGVFGDEKIMALRAADCLILPSYSENFGNVVAEALACETPVITTTGTPWSEIEEVGCGLYVEPEAEALYQAMKAMYLKSPEERREMGRRGREYVLKNFNWEDKARELFKHLEKLAPKGKM